MSEQPRPVDIYARVSRKGDKEQRSTTGQLAVCRTVLADRGLTVGLEHVDDGDSAWNPRVRRDGWDALMTRLESGVAGGVCCFDLERFSRQPAEGERLIAAAERGLLVLDSDQQLDLSTASGKKAFRDAMAAAAYYSDRLSDRVKRGKAAKARNGEVQRGRSDANDGARDNRAFGFEDDNVTVRQADAAVIRWAAEHLLHGDAQDALVAHLNARGVTTAAGGPWTQRGLRDMLLRPRNAGQINHNGVIVAQLPGAPILEPATLGRLTALYAARRRGRPNSPAYICSGVAYCGRCGKRLAGRPRTGRRPYDDGAVRREYWCSPSAYGGCGRTFADQRDLDEEARRFTILVLSDPRHASQIEAEAADRAEELRDLDALIAADEQIVIAMDARLTGLEITLERHGRIVAPIEKRLAELTARRAEIADPEVGNLQKLDGGDWAARWDAGLPDERRSWLRTALRGRRLIVGAPDPDAPADISRRLTVDDAETVT